MAIMSYLGGPSPLLPGEVLLHTQGWLRLLVSKSGISYRMAFNMWPLWTCRFEVTNRRFRALGNMFLIMTQDISLWYPGRNPEGDAEVMTSVSIEMGPIGRRLAVKSHNPERTQWYWAPDLTLRFYFKDPESVERIIVDAMK